jgi:ATP-dependent Clp protease protease subunit
MAGYRILKAMEGSDAPIHVVVKSFAASMAACITTLAEESYAYPNAIILHHQISSSYFFTTMNLTQQKESYEDSKKWWEKLAAPIAKKMNITTDEFIKQMYEKNSDGDWVEFASEAQKLKWVNHIVSSIKETSAVINPDSIKAKKDEKEALEETVGKDGKPCIYLPRLNPHDAYFLYIPDGYYRLKQ